VEGFPIILKGLDSIWVVMERLSKSTNFAPINIRHLLEVAHFIRYESCSGVRFFYISWRCNCL